MESLIRRLHPGEGDLYRQIRLAALADSPGAFATTLADSLGRSAESWAAQADSSATGNDRATFILPAEMGGLGAIYRDASDPREGELIQMWVAPELRGSRAAADLLEALLSWAAGNGFTAIRAEVTPQNGRALRFYEKHGFEAVETAEDGMVRLRLHDLHLRFPPSGSD